MLAASLLLACNPGELPAPALDRLRLPTGALLTPDGGWLLVSNSNLDQRDAASTLVAIDVARLDAARAAPLAVGATPTSARPCRRTEDGVASVECDVRLFIDPQRTIRLPSGAGNIALDRPSGTSGPLRLLIPSGVEPAVTWVDVLVGGAGELDVDCGQDGEGMCDTDHVLKYLANRTDSTRLPDDPARIFVDEAGFRYAYLPHLLGSMLTLIALDAEFGPKITDIEKDFYRPDPVNMNTFAGGFAVAQRACDPADPPTSTRDCSRPLLYTTHRFWPGVRVFSVYAGRDTIIPGGDHALTNVNPFESEDRPFMADLKFEDPATGERLLVVHTTPPSLEVIDTRLDEENDPADSAIANVSLCRNPNILAVHRPPAGERLALVSCYSDDQVAVVGLGSFQVIATVAVDDGPNELVIDDARRWLYTVNTLTSTIDVLDLDRLSPTFLRVVLRIGLLADEA